MVLSVNAFFIGRGDFGKKWTDLTLPELLFFLRRNEEEKEAEFVQSVYLQLIPLMAQTKEGYAEIEKIIKKPQKSSDSRDGGGDIERLRSAFMAIE